MVYLDHYHRSVLKTSSDSNDLHQMRIFFGKSFVEIHQLNKHHNYIHMYSTQQSEAESFEVVSCYL